MSPLRLAAPSFIPVYWQGPPPLNWLKINTDGSFRGPSMASFGGIFRDSNDHFHGAFSFNVDVPSALDIEVLAVIEVIRVA